MPQFAGSGNLRMDLSKLSHRRAIHQHPGRASGMIVVSSLSVEAQRTVLKNVQEILYVAFQREKSSVVSTPRFRLSRRRRDGSDANSPGLDCGRSRGFKNAARLEQTHIARAAVQ